MISDDIYKKTFFPRIRRWNMDLLKKCIWA